MSLVATPKCLQHWYTHMDASLRHESVKCILQLRETSVFFFIKNEHACICGAIAVDYCELYGTIINFVFRSPLHPELALSRNQRPARPVHPTPAPRNVPDRENTSDRQADTIEDCSSNTSTITQGSTLDGHSANHTSGTSSSVTPVRPLPSPGPVQVTAQVCNFLGPLDGCKLKITQNGSSIVSCKPDVSQHSDISLHQLNLFLEAWFNHECTVER